VWFTEEGHHRLTFWDEQQVVLEGDTVHCTCPPSDPKSCPWKRQNPLRRTPPSVRRWRHCRPSSCRLRCRRSMSPCQRTREWVELLKKKFSSGSDPKISIRTSKHRITSDSC
jgi:hypothetical protein